MFASLRFLFLAFLLGPVTAGNVAAQGVISGVVLDQSTEQAVVGAVVRITELNRETTTDRSGRFQFVSIPDGSYTLTTRYIGYAPVTERVTVTASRATVTIRIAPTVTQLGTILVTATRTGQAAALNQQQNASNLTNVVAADQVGRFSDANIGDALKRIPGITIGLDQGEARFGSIRGTEPRFNTVMVNGERIPSAEAEIREVQLDLVPADMVQAIEVNKTLTPEMDADAIGGAVNLVTRAAPAGFRLSSTLGTGYNFIRDQPVALGAGVVGTRFAQNRVGVIVSGSYYDQQFGSDNKEGVWNRTDGGQAYLEEFDVRRYDVQRIRRSISGSLDWRISPDHTVMFRSLYNHRDDWENRFRLRYILDGPDGSGVQSAELRRQTKGGGPGNKDARLEDQRTQSHQLSGEHLLGRFATLTWSGTIARASETRPDERYIEWRARNVDVRGSYADQQNPSFTALDAGDVAPTAFTFRRIEVLESFTRDLDKNARVDLLLPFRKGASAVRVGARIRDKDKLRDNRSDFAVPVTSSSFANLTAQESRDFTVDNNLAGNYSYGTFSTPQALGSFAVRDPSRFRLVDRPGDYAAGNFNASERITAGYLQLEQRLSPTVGVIAGVRVERTSVDYRGYQYDLDTDAITPTTGGRAYTDVLPGLNLRWAADPKTVVRAAWTNSLARPNYFDLVPYREVSLDDDELATGNSDLKATKSMNFDLGVERYFSSVGVVSLGVFHKRITDFIFHFTQFGAVDPVSGNTFSQITQPRNGAKASLTGVEAAFQRQLDFLPGVLRYLGVYTNYTFVESGVSGLDIPGRDLESLPLLGTPKHSGNFSLSFDPPRASFRLAVNYQSESLDAGEGGYNEDAFFDRWFAPRTDVDFSGSFQLARYARFFLEASNLTNRPLRFYQGVSGRLMQDEFYGRRIQTGLKLDF
jgi:TonB-dependent receptor